MSEVSENNYLQYYSPQQNTYVSCEAFSRRKHKSSEQRLSLKQWRMVCRSRWAGSMHKPQWACAILRHIAPYWDCQKTLGEFFFIILGGFAHTLPTHINVQTSLKVNFA